MSSNSTIKIIEWQNCYKGSWKGLIHDDSFQHPAKFAQGLVFRIVEYALEQGYIKVGDKVLDCFGGVGLGGLPSVNSGLIWQGNELESKFYLDAYKNFALWCERFWCVCDDPEYLELLRQYATPKDEESPQLSLFTQGEVNPDDLLEQIKAHTIASWDKPNKGEWCASCNKLIVAYPLMTKGDSRHLGSIMQEQVGGVVLSPPFVDSLANLASGGTLAANGLRPDGSKRGGSLVTGDYGDSPSQLGNLDSIVSSPPYIDSLDNPNKSGIDPDKFKTGHGPNTQALSSTQYGQEDGQLGSLKEGSLDSLISSSPFADSIGSDDPDRRGGLYRDPQFRYHKNMTGNYGSSEGQLGKLKDEGFDASIGSPPFADKVPSQANQEWHQKRDSIGGNNSLGVGNYGTSEGQLGTMSDKGLNAIVGSPPYADQPTKTGKVDESRWSDGRQRSVGASQNNSDGYGSEPGQLGTMKDEGFDMSVSSPLLAGTMPGSDSVNFETRPDGTSFGAGKSMQVDGYGAESGQLANLPDKGFDLSVSSPSFAGNSGGRGEASRNGIDPALFDRSSGGMKRGTGDSEDNLDHLSMTGFDSAVSSPPFEQANKIGNCEIARTGTPHSKPSNLASTGGYRIDMQGSTDGQLGNSTGANFWSASKDILLQCWQLLKPGGESIPDGEDIDFCDC